MDRDWFRTYFGHYWEVPTAVAVVLVIYGVFLVLRPRSAPLWRLVVACFVSGPTMWLLSARATQRLLPPVVAYLVMSGLLLATIAAALQASIPIYIRVLAAGVAGMLLLALAKWWWGL